MADIDYNALARVAFDVSNWARRLGLKKEEQIDQMARAIKAEHNGEPWPQD